MQWNKARAPAPRPLIVTDCNVVILPDRPSLRYDLIAFQRSRSIASIAGIARAKARSADSAVVERTLFWAFIAGLAWCPFWFGSHNLLAWGINAVLFPGLAAIHELSLLITGKRHPVAIWQIKASAALFGAVVLWILIQNATWTPAWFHYPIWQMTADALGQPVDGSISVDRELTSLALLRLITAASVFWIALQLCRDASRAGLLLWSIAAITCAYAAYGLVAHWFAPERILWSLGKNANCQTLVSPTLACGEVPVMVALRLFLPESWTSDPAR